jgi:hypothetical protein
MHKEVLFALGGNVVLLAAVSWLIKSILTHFLSKDIEIYKQTLKAESEKVLIEHDTVFRSLHSKRAEVIANLHSQLVEVSNCMNAINNIFQNQKSKGESPEISAERSSQLMKCLLPCWDYFSANKLYFSSELSESIKDLLMKCMSVATLTAVTQEQDISSLPFDFRNALENIDKNAILEVTSKFISDFNKAIKEIEKTFRMIVGITG